MEPAAPNFAITETARNAGHVPIAMAETVKTNSLAMMKTAKIKLMNAAQMKVKNESYT